MNSFHKWAWLAAFLMLNAWTLAAVTPTNYTITVNVTIDNDHKTGAVAFVHNQGYGSNGNQVASSMNADSVQWICGSNCVNVYVVFERRYTPCSNGSDLYQPPSGGTAQSVPCTVADGANTKGYVSSYPYNIAVYWSNGSSSNPISGLALIDPDVIVDNNPTVPQKINPKKPAAKGAPTKP
jgi:hypothetical protein